MNVLDEVVTCDRSSMIIALPDSEASFFRSKILGDFAKRFSTYDEYSAAVSLCNYRPRFNDLAQRSELTVVWNAHAADLIRALETKRLVILLAHHNEERTEIDLLDEMVPADELCGRMPIDWSGFLDASTCFSNVLVESYLSRFQGRARLSFVQQQLRTRLWLEYYLIFFRALLERPAPLGQFLIELQSEFERLVVRALKNPASSVEAHDDDSN